jgi:hypothetical protein
MYDVYDLRDRLAEQPTHSGKIRWFDGMTGEGMVRLDDGTNLYLHFSAIYGIDKNNYQWPKVSEQAFLDKLAGQPVMVQPYVTSGYVGCMRVVLMNYID